MRIVRALPHLESGRADLELRNGFDHRVLVKDTFLTTGSLGPLKSLIEGAKELQPEQRQYIDVTEKLDSLFDPKNSGLQEKIVKISFSLDLEPPQKPQPSYYRIRYQNGRLISFSSG